MKIVVIGCGKVGNEIVRLLCNEGHEITIIDTKIEVVNRIVEKYDISGFVGNGASLDIQKQAIDNKTSLVIAVTELDEINILACVSAKKLGASKTIARIRDRDYYKDADWLAKAFEIDLIVNPESETSSNISNFLIFPEALRVDVLANGKVDLVEFLIKKDNPLIGRNLYSINNEFDVKILVCAVQRNNEVFIPDGSYTFQENDRIHITASRSNMKIFFHKLGLLKNKIKSVFIIGGGGLGVYLAEQLLEAQPKYDVKIIDHNHERCMEIAEQLPNAAVIYGDGSDQDLLISEGIKNTDAVVALTGLDEENIIVGMYSKLVGVSKTIVKINKIDLEKMLSSVTDFTTISPKQVSTAKIVSFARSLALKFHNKMENLYMLVDNKVEVSEFIASKEDLSINIELKDLHIKKGFLVAAIIRKDEVIIPQGTDMINEGDCVIIVSSNEFIDELDDIVK